MLDTVTLITLLAMGVLLCFYGFRMFRFSMAIAGFFMGFHAANLIDSLFLLEKIPEKGRTVFEFFFPIMFGIFIAVISYAIYKKALFFITVFFTWYSIVKIFLLYIVKTQNNLKLVVSLSPDKVAKLTDGSENTQNLIPDKQMNAVMPWLPGSADGQKLLAICLIALVIAILTGIVVNFYNEILELRRKETLSAFLDRLEKLPELSHEELVEMSERVHKFRLQKK